MRQLLPALAFLFIAAQPLTLTIQPTPHGEVIHGRVTLQTGNRLSMSVTATCRPAFDTLPELWEIIFDTAETCSEMYLLEQIAWSESTGGRHLQNPYSSARGAYQYLASTWASHCTGDVMSFQDSTRCALNDIRKGRLSQWALYNDNF